jgi:hypothetical protein
MKLTPEVVQTAIETMLSNPLTKGENLTSHIIRDLFSTSESRKMVREFCNMVGKNIIQLDSLGKILGPDVMPVKENIKKPKQVMYDDVNPPKIVEESIMSSVTPPPLQNS